MEDNCEGCAAECDSYFWNETGKCPCTLCIVKAMCLAGNECREWNKWFGIEKWEKEQKNKRKRLSQKKR
jgi:hypothetical protein